MEAETRTLKLIRQGDRCFEIPASHRPYVWDQQTQWEPLWSDIEDTACRLGEIRLRAMAEGQDVAMADRQAVPHFLGAIVVEQQATAIGEADVRSVVDGQQRLTTLQLVLRGVLDALVDVGISGKPVAQLRKLVANDDEIVEGTDVSRVLPRPADRDDFFAAMAERRLAPHLSAFAAARAFFADAARSFVQDPKVPQDAYTQGSDIERRASLLVSTLTGLLKVVVIDLEDVDDAQVIFEALNARGTPLSATDLVKNLLFMKAQRETGNAQKLYDVHWQRFDDDGDWWRETIGVGHAQRPRQDWLLGDWLIAETGRVISIGQLYGDFRRWLEESGRLSDSLSHLNGYADAYEMMRGRRAGASGREQRAFERLEVLNITAAAPLMLWLLVQPEDRLPRGERERAICAIESFVVRRMAEKWQTPRLRSALRGRAQGGEGGRDQPGPGCRRRSQSRPGWLRLANAGRTARGIPQGTLLRAGGINQSRLRLPLGAVDASLQATATKSEPLTVDYRNLTVEHIIPQKWREFWPITEPDEAARLRATQRREGRIHCIGNLTLVTETLNPALSNDPWEAKREALRDHSKLQFNALLCQRDLERGRDRAEMRMVGRADRGGLARARLVQVAGMLSDALGHSQGLGHDLRLSSPATCPSLASSTRFHRAR